MKRSRKISFDMHKFLNYLTAIAVALTFTSQVLAQGAPPFNPQFLMPADPDTVVLSYTQTPDMLGNPDTTPMIRVYGDGEVLIHYPVYMKRAGDYQVFLNPGELRKLLVAVSGVFDFDAKRAAQARHAAKQARVPLLLESSARSDQVLEQFDVILDGYQESPGVSLRAINKNVKWRDIEVDAAEFPSVTSLDDLNGARQALLKLLERADLVDLNSGNAVKPLVEAGSNQ
jgi:hypothetical protein